MRIKVGAAQTWEVLEAAYHAAIGETFEIGAPHVCYQFRVGAEGTHGQAGIIGIGQHIYNWHEVHIQPERRQVFCGAKTGIVSILCIACGTNGLF